MRARIALAEKGIEYEYREELVEQRAHASADEPGSQESPGSHP